MPHTAGLAIIGHGKQPFSQRSSKKSTDVPSHSCFRRTALAVILTALHKDVTHFFEQDCLLSPRFASRRQ